jgi:hypothetical protein
MIQSGKKFRALRDKNNLFKLSCCPNYFFFSGRNKKPFKYWTTVNTNIHILNNYLHLNIGRQ